MDYVPAIIRSRHHSPIDALVALGVIREEACELVIASWPLGSAALFAESDGARPVAAIPLPDGIWAACNAYPEHASRQRTEAERQLARIAKRGKEGLIAERVC